MLHSVGIQCNDVFKDVDSMYVCFPDVSETEVRQIVDLCQLLMEPTVCIGDHCSGHSPIILPSRPPRLWAVLMDGQWQTVLDNTRSFNH